MVTIIGPHLPHKQTTGPDHLTIYALGMNPLALEAPGVRCFSARAGQEAFLVIRNSFAGRAAGSS